MQCKKKIFTLLLAVAASIGTMFADLCNSEGVCFTLYTDNTAAVSGFSGNLTDVTIPPVVTYENVAYTVKYIAEGAFSGCTSLTSISIPEAVTYIGNRAFYGCTSLTSISIPEAVTYIGSSAFYACINLTSINIPSGITSLNNNTFQTCSSLSSVLIPEGVTSIGESAFSGCSSLTSVTIPGSVKSIGYMAFANCNSLASLTIEEGVEIIDMDAFINCNKLDSIIIPNSVTSIGQWAFLSCGTLTSVKIGSNLKTIGYQAFKDCRPTSVIWNAIDGAAFNFGSQVELFTFGNSVKVIPSSLCKGMNLLTSIIIPDSVVSIGEDAFYNCSGLGSVSIGKKVTNIGSNAFSNCPNIQSVIWNAKECNNYKEGLGSMSWTAPIFISPITSFKFGNEVENIPEKLCNNLTLLSNINIPNSVTNIGSSAFEGCIGLNSVLLPVNIHTIQGSTFKNCTGLTSITIGNNITEIGASAFYGCTGLNSLTIENSVTEIGKSAFSGCSGLTSIAIGNSVTNIGSSAFADCSNLSSVTFPASVTRIDNGAFNNCTSLQFIKFLGETAPIMQFPFANTNDCPIYIPCNSYTSYSYALPTYYERLTLSSDCVPSYVVTFVDWNGQVLKIEQVEEGHSATAPANPTREGYTFTGWDKDFSNVQSDLIVTAQYIQNTPSTTYYTVTFKDWDGTVLKTQQVEKGHSATAPANPTREGYTFTGWDKDFSNVQSNLTVTAQYQKNETPVTNAITVRLKASSATGWSKVNLYYWADGITSPAWPGITISKDADGWYSHTFDASVTSVNIIWNDGTNQTIDITNVTESTCYSLKSTSGKTIGVNVVECQAAAPVSVTGGSLNKKTLQMVVGNTATVTASVLPANASNKSVTWTSSNATTATVSSTGTISAKAEGVTTITCKTIDGSFTAECYVVVSAVNSEYTFSYEPTNATVINYTATELSYSEIPENNCVFAALADNAHTLHLMYVGSLVNGKIPQGNYKITSTLQNGTFCYSVGGDDQYDYGSYMATDFDSEGYYTSAYYIIAGDIAIGSKNNYTVKVVSANGTDINVTYNGTQDIENISSDIKAAKILRDGQILILRGDKTYTLQGQEVK